jgi:hypothetical protein
MYAYLRPRASLELRNGAQAGETLKSVVGYSIRQPRYVEEDPAQPASWKASAEYAAGERCKGTNQEAGMKEGAN